MVCGKRVGIFRNKIFRKEGKVRDSRREGGRDRREGIKE